MLKEPLSFVRNRTPHATTISRALAGVSLIHAPKDYAVEFRPRYAARFWGYHLGPFQFFANLMCALSGLIRFRHS